MLEINRIINTDMFQSALDAIQSSNKYFKLEETDKLYIINNNHIISGIIVLDTKADTLYVSVYQSPRVCRLSIISLLEASVIIANKEVSIQKQVCFVNTQESYNFKYRSLFKTYNEDDTLFRVESSLVKNITIPAITKKQLKLDGLINE